jgi:fatty-acid desaturase
LTAKLADPAVVGSPDGCGRLALPAGVNPRRIVWRYAIPLAGYHLLALLAFMPWFFSWTGVVVAFIGVYVFGGFGVDICYHRLLAHRGFVCPKWLEHLFAVIGLWCFQDTPARWVAAHRRHHQHADEQSDPHSPLVNFFWAHVGWLLVENRDLPQIALYDRYAKDIVRDPFYRNVERYYVWIVFSSWIVFFSGGFAAGLLTGDTGPQAAQFGASVLLWGVVVRTVVVWHITWSVNSVTHIWGYRNYETDEASRNNVLVAILTSGEGWHNNHHADQRAAKHGHLWWEIDLVYLTIRLLAALGLANDIVMPHPGLAAARTKGRLITRGSVEDQ